MLDSVTRYSRSTEQYSALRNTVYTVHCTVGLWVQFTIINYRSTLQLCTTELWWSLTLQLIIAVMHCSHALQLYAAYLQAPCIVGSGGYFLTPTFIIATSHNSKHGRNLYRMWCRTCLDIRRSYTVYGILYSIQYIL